MCVSIRLHAALRSENAAGTKPNALRFHVYRRSGSCLGRLMIFCSSVATAAAVLDTLEALISNPSAAVWFGTSRVTR
jgi:hypothetical protein